MADETTALCSPQNGSSLAQQSYQSFAKDPSIHQTSDVESDSVTLSSTKPPAEPLTNVGSIIAVLLLGEFISNADASLIMAATARISSEFNQLQGASWLSTGYTLGVCAAQPIYGKLSDIYGRKRLLLASYFFLAFGCLVCGLGVDLWVVILGRILSGVGGAGVMAMSAVIITDIVAKRDVAKWRAYVNVSMTLGRSVGGPVGGILTDTIGWRWAFLLQVPIVALAAILVVIRLKLVQPALPGTGEDRPTVRRIDFSGVLLLATSITVVVLLFDQGGKSFSWISLPALLLASSGAVTMALFVYVELFVAAEPIFDLHLLRRPNIVSSYIISSLQVGAQVGMMFSVPLYFQVTGRASSTVAGAHLVPGVVGNAIGGLIAGNIIRRTGNYKPTLVLSGLVASVTYTLQLVRWNGRTGPWESFYIIFGGMGTGLASSASFVSMTAFLEPQDVAMATGGYLLLLSFAMTAGVTTTNTVLGLEFKKQLQSQLNGPGASKVIERALSSIQYIIGLSGPLRDIVVRCYVAGLKHAYIVSLVWSLLSSVTALGVRNHRV